MPGLDRLGFQLGQRLEFPEAGTHFAGVELWHLDRLEARLDERPSYLLGQHLGALVGPHEVVADGGGDRVLQLGADLGPVVGRVGGVDHVLGVLGDGPEPAAQVVVDIGCQIGDSVVEHLLPQRGLLKSVLGFLLAPLELCLQSVASIRDR